MTGINASAPGKVIIAGEYAVLDGAPAVCMAVNRRVRVSLSVSQEKNHVIAAPGFSGETVRCNSIAESAAAYPLLAAVWQELQVDTAEFFDIVLDSSGFVNANAEKMGIGSSAATTVALTAALAHLAGDDVDIRSIAMAAHRSLQGGAGSGTDIACSLAGGVIGYRMGEPASTTLQWPADLHYALLWSGVPVATRAQLEKLDNAEARGSRTDLSDAAVLVAQTWSTGDPDKIIDSLRDFVVNLRRFDVDHELGIFDAGHAALADQANSATLVYKPCGAGGGDLGIAISSDRIELAAFVSRASEQGFKPVDLAIDTTGVAVDGKI